MKELIGEILSMSVMFVVIILFVLYKSKKEREFEKIDKNYKKSLKDFGLLFGFEKEFENFDQLIDVLVKNSKVKVVQKDTLMVQFIRTIGVENFKNLDEEKIKNQDLSEVGILECSKFLKSNLALGILSLNNDNFVVILEAKNRLLDIIDSCSKLGENIILYD